MIRIIVVLLFLFNNLIIYTQTGLPDVDQAIGKGNFTQAQNLIKQHIREDSLSAEAVWELNLQSAILDRIRQDFSRDEAYIKETLGKYYPDLTEDQLTGWENSGKLEMRVIDGEKRYFHNAIWNLFRVDAEARVVKEKVDGKKEDELSRFLAGYLPQAIASIPKGQNLSAQPKTIRITYTLRVKPNAVPAGETVRAWLPYPRTDRDRLTKVKLLDASEESYILSPEAYDHSSIYMEKTAQKDEWTEFRFQAEYQAYDEWHDLLNADIQAYDKDSGIVKTYTTEREGHVIFTPEIRQLSAEIVGNETDPLQKAWLIYQWIGKNIPWTSALEYSTIPNIPAYCVENRRGDCGQKALLFITLLRYNGIPAKWQSGWFLYPEHKNLHDWSEVYFEGPGWVPVDPDFNLQNTSDEKADAFFFGGADAYRLIVNNDFSGAFFPAKVYPRSETVDFQRGEVEWRGGNLYFDQWRYQMEVAYP